MTASILRQYTYRVPHVPVRRRPPRGPWRVSGLILLLLAIAFLASGCVQAPSQGQTSKARGVGSFESVGSFDVQLEVVVDSARHVACYSYYYHNLSCVKLDSLNR